MTETPQESSGPVRAGRIGYPDRYTFTRTETGRWVTTEAPVTSARWNELIDPETPQDAREVEQRERSIRWFTALNVDSEFDIVAWGKLYRAAIAEADREQAAFVARCDALERDLAQAVSEQDRLRAGIEALHHPSVDPAWCDEDGFSWPCATARLLAKPDADAQDEGAGRWRRQRPVLWCDGDDSECGAWDIDAYAENVSTIDGRPVTSTERAPGWMTVGDEDFCPEHKPAQDEGGQR